MKEVWLVGRMWKYEEQDGYSVEAFTNYDNAYDGFLKAINDTKDSLNEKFDWISDDMPYKNNSDDSWHIWERDNFSNNHLSVSIKKVMLEDQ